MTLVRSSGKTLKQVLPDVAIMLLVLAAYLPAFHAGFIWDDDAHLTANPHIVGSLGLRGVWTTSAATYYPLVLTSFWLQHALWGLDPLPYHVVNVIFHGLCAILLRRVLLRLNLNRAAAWLGATLWALHPVQVESAAWITELKNTQSCLFYLLAILFFLRWRERTAPEEKSSPILYTSFLLCMVLSLLSKTSTVMLPVVVGLCAWWLDGKWSWRTLKGLAPLFVISGVAGGWTVWEQKYHSGALGADWSQNFLERIAIAGKCIWFYLGKLAWPQPLIFIYPHWNIDTHDIFAFLPALAAVGVLIVFYWFRNSWSRSLFFAFAYFLVSLFPVLGFFNVYFFRYSFVADHFQYLASMGPLVLVGAGLVRAAEMQPHQSRWLLPLISGALVVLFAVLTTQHIDIFRNEEALWGNTIRNNPDSWLAHNNLAAIYLDRGNLTDATTQLEMAIKLRPQYAEAQANLAEALIDSGEVDEAISHFRLALKDQPNVGRTHNDLGAALMTSGRVDEAIEEIGKAIVLNPHDMSAQDNMGIALAQKGQVGEALWHFYEAVKGSPKNIGYGMSYGKALLFQQQYPEASAEFSEILKLDPAYEPAHKFLGITLLDLHQTNEALTHLREAVRLDPRDAEARQKLAEIEASVPQ